MENKKPLEGIALENYQAVVADLDVIVLAKPTLDLLKTNADFQTLVSKDITIVQEYEQKYEVSSENLTRFANAYQSITGKEFVPVQGIDVNHEIEIKDTIKYNRVFIKNITHLDFDEIASSLNPHATEKVEAVETTQQEAQEAMAVGAVAGANTNNSYNDSYGNGYGPGVYNKLSNDATEQFVAQSAASVLNYHVIKGDVYIFKSKPKIIPILKWLTMAFYALVFILNIVALVFSIMANGTITYQGTPEGQTQEVIVKWGEKGGALPFQIIELVLIGIIIGMSIWSIARTFKNENQKYRYSWGWNLFYILFLFLFGMLAMGLNQVIAWDSVKDQIQNWNNTSQAQIDKFYNLQNCVYVNYALYAILGAMVIILVIGAICNPQRDIERLQQLLQQYADQIRSGAIDPSQFGNGGGFMSQMGF